LQITALRYAILELLHRSPGRSRLNVEAPSFFYAPMLNLEALSRSFSYEPVLSALFVLLATLTVASVVVGLYVAIRSGYDLLQQKLQGRLRGVVISDRTR
jgi:hypothetical protein